MYRTTVTKSTKTSATRTCSHCKHIWFYEVIVEASAASSYGTMDSDFKIADEKASERLAEGLRTAGEHEPPCYEAICPKCGHLSTVAKEKYFSNGYSEGLKSFFIKSGKNQVPLSIMWFTIALISILLIYAIFIGVKYGFQEGEEGFWGMVLIIGGGIVLGLFSLFLTIFSFIESWNCLKLSFSYSNNYKKVLEKIDSISDDGALQIITDCYHKNDKTFPKGSKMLHTLLEHFS